MPVLTPQERAEKCVAHALTELTYSAPEADRNGIWVRHVQAAIEQALEMERDLIASSFDGVRGIPSKIPQAIRDRN